MKNIFKKSGKNITSKSSCFFTLIFFDVGANLDGFWPPSWTLQNGHQQPFFQVAAKRRPRGAQEAPRASQGRLKSLRQPPKRAPRVPKSDQNVPRARPRCLQRVTFLRISLFFNVFLRFSAFSCVFLRFSVFFCVFLQHTPVNFSTLSSKLNCVRQQAKASSLRSKPKEAKASKSQLEFKLKISSTLDRACFCQAWSSVELIFDLNSKRFGK